MPAITTAGAGGEAHIGVGCLQQRQQIDGIRKERINRALIRIGKPNVQLIGDAVVIHPGPPDIAIIQPSCQRGQHSGGNVTVEINAYMITTVLVDAAVVVGVVFDGDAVGDACVTETPTGTADITGHGLHNKRQTIRSGAVVVSECVRVRADPEAEGGAEGSIRIQRNAFTQKAAATLPVEIGQTKDGGVGATLQRLPGGTIERKRRCNQHTAAALGSQQCSTCRLVEREGEGFVELELLIRKDRNGDGLAGFAVGKGHRDGCGIKV